MNSHNGVAAFSVASLLAGLLTTSALSAADQPTPQSGRTAPADWMLAQMWGNGWGMRDGMCDGWMEGMMMGGQMPRGTDPAQLPNPQAPGARLLNQYCTQCHGLPTPALHSAAGWPPVVERMNARMQWMSRNSRMPIKAPNAAEFKSIVEYLQRHAGQGG